MLLSKTKKNQGGSSKGGNRLLISVTVLGSAGPIRFVVSEQELVAAVIDTSLKSYAREGRLPVLGSDLNDFFLYCPSAGSGGTILINPLSITHFKILDFDLIAYYVACIIDLGLFWMQH
ncbi:hypothetical protein LINGRAHAP2_LOCUS37312 [Linum grandiflorum]